MTQRFIVIIDAGLTGSRIFIYRTPVTDNESQRDRHLGVHQIDSFVAKTAEGDSIHNALTLPKMQAHLNQLLEPANKELQNQNADAGNTVIYMFATGGMRSLGVADYNTALGLARGVIQDFPNPRYTFVQANIRTITEQQEGWFTWVYQNYGLIPPREGGSLQMGGASIQYTYTVDAPNVNTAPICPDPNNPAYKENVYSQTWEGLGSQALNDDLVNTLHNNFDCPTQPCNNPCLPNGMQTVRGNIQTVGTGDFESCHAFAISRHADQGVPILAPLPGIEILRAMSGFYHTYQFFMPSSPGAQCQYDATLFGLRVQNYCGGNWGGVNPDGSNPNIYTETMCLNAASMMVSFENAATPIFFTKGNDMVWTHGAVALIANYDGLRFCPGVDELQQYQPSAAHPLDGKFNDSLVHNIPRTIPASAQLQDVTVAAPPSVMLWTCYLLFAVVLVFVGRLVQRSRAKAHCKTDLEENTGVGVKENMQERLQ